MIWFFFLFKPVIVGRNIALHAVLAYSGFYLCLVSAFLVHSTSFPPNISPILKSGMCIKLQIKIVFTTTDDGRTRYTDLPVNTTNVTLYKKTRHKSQFAIWHTIKVKSLFCFLLKVNFTNEDKVKSVRDNGVMSSALYSAVCILIISVKVSFPPKWPYTWFSHAQSQMYNWAVSAQSSIIIPSSALPDRTINTEQTLNDVESCLLLEAGVKH